MLTVRALSARLGGCLRKIERLRYNMSVYPEVRVYADPFEGLTVQLNEMRGLIKIVPPLIEADRDRRWPEIGSRPGDPDGPDMIDIYEATATLQEYPLPNGKPGMRSDTHANCGTPWCTIRASTRGRT
jgi:hypothetical protein